MEEKMRSFVGTISRFREEKEKLATIIMISATTVLSWWFAGPDFNRADTWGQIDWFKVFGLMTLYAGLVISGVNRILEFDFEEKQLCRFGKWVAVVCLLIFGYLTYYSFAQPLTLSTCFGIMVIALVCWVLGVYVAEIFFTTLREWYRMI